MRPHQHQDPVQYKKTCLTKTLYLNLQNRLLIANYAASITEKSSLCIKQRFFIRQNKKTLLNLTVYGLNFQRQTLFI